MTVHKKKTNYNSEIGWFRQPVHFKNFILILIIKVKEFALIKKKKFRHKNVKFKISLEFACTIEVT